MCIEVEKKKDVFSLGGSINFAGHSHFWCPFWWNYSYQRNAWPWNIYLFPDLLSLYWYCLQYIFLDLRNRFLIWCLNLGISMYCFQELMKSIEAHESSGICHKMPPIITHIFKSTLNLKSPPLCPSCQLACLKHHSTNQPTKAQLDWDGAFSQVTYEDGDFVCADQYIGNTHGRLLFSYGREALYNNFIMAHCFMMLLLVLAGVMIKSLLELVKLWWPNKALNNGMGIGCYWKSPPALLQ